MKKVIVSVTNDLVTDQRVSKSCSTLKGMGFEVTLIGRKRRNSQAVVPRGYKMHRMKLLFEKGPMFYAEFNIRLFLYLLFSRANVLLSNDLDSLPANFLAHKLKNIPLVFDSHEYFPEVPELQHRPKVKNIWLKIEKMLIPKVKIGYTVSKGIADIYQSKYNKEFKVVRNVPYILNSFNHLPAPIKLPKDKRIILYQGSLNMGRGLELAIQSMEYIHDAILLIIGEGDITTDLKKLATNLGINDRVIFTGRIPLEKLPSYTKLGTIGITLEENIGLNYYYSLPNKFFDYIQSGLPVLISPFPETKRVVDKYNIGESVKERDPQKLAQQLSALFNDTKTLEVYAENTKKAASELCWENEEKVINEIFKPYA